MNKRNVDDGDIRYARIGRHQQRKKTTTTNSEQRTNSNPVLIV